VGLKPQLNWPKNGKEVAMTNAIIEGKCEVKVSKHGFEDQRVREGTR